MSDPLYCPWILSAPCLKPEVWAAWAQASLSVIAIYAASRLAARQERLAFLRKAEACVALLTHVETALQSVVNEPLSRTSLACVKRLTQQVDVTLDAAPDQRLVAAVSMAANDVAVLFGELDAHSNNIRVTESFRSDSARADVRTALARVATARKLAQDVVDSTAPFSLFRCLQHQWKLTFGAI